MASDEIPSRAARRFPLAEAPAAYAAARQIGKDIKGHIESAAG
ncbi:MAG: hypothetical protein V7637_5871 [Mycobacteriales bacterium]